MGLTWTFDIIAFAVQPYEQNHIGIEILVILFLVINASHGVIFFCTIFFNSENISGMQSVRNANIGRKISNTRTFRSISSNTTRTTTDGSDPLTESNRKTVRIHVSNTQLETAL